MLYFNIQLKSWHPKFFCIERGGAAMDKKLWIFWSQGERNAPDLVQHCIASWRRNHPDWDVHVLDAETVGEFVSFDPAITLCLNDLTHQTLSDLIRVSLLTRHGGVWVDSTTYCTRPLERWLPAVMPSGFFAFRGPRKERPFDNWFLATEPGNHLIARMDQELQGFFAQHRFPIQTTPIRKLCHDILKPVFAHSPATTQFWFSDVVVKGLKIYPYFAWHYIFFRLVTNECECRRIWAETPELSISPAIIVKDYGKRLGATGVGVPTEVRDVITSGQTPIHKLRWKSDTNHRYWREALEMLAAAR